MATINESIEKLNSYIKEIDDKLNSFVDELDPETKEKLIALSQKTKETILKSIAKLEDLKGSNVEESILNDFLNRLDVKCKEVCDYTLNKLDSFKPVKKEALEDFINSLDEDTKETKENKANNVEFKLSDTYDRLINNPNVVNATNMVKAGVEKAIEFYNSDETQEFINTMKIKTINIAEKGLEELKIILDRADKKDGE